MAPKPKITVSPQGIAHKLRYRSDLLKSAGAAAMTHVCDIDDLGDIVRFSTLSDGRAAIVTVPVGSYGRPHGERDDMTVILVSEAGQETRPLPTSVAPFVEVLPGGELLVAHPGYRTVDGIDRPNLIVLDGDVVTERFVIGSHIDDLKVDRDGLIWVSFYDEGVFGAGAYGERHGLVCWTPKGERLWGLRTNVDVSSEVWISPDFAGLNPTPEGVLAGALLIAQADGSVTVLGLDQELVYQPSALSPTLVGSVRGHGRGQNTDVITVRDRGGSAATSELGNVMLVTPGGRPLPDERHTDVRGDTIYCVFDGALHAIAVDELAEPARIAREKYERWQPVE